MLNEDVLISSMCCCILWKLILKSFYFTSRSNMQMAMQNMNVVFVAIFCQELTYCAYERWLDLTLMYEWQFCTELR